MKFTIPSPFFSGIDSFGSIFLVAWGIYIAVYWFCLLQILRASKFDATDKILWFLVITLAPILGILSYVFLCPVFVRNHANPDGRPGGPSSPL